MKEIKKAEYFSVFADETVDLSGTEQLPICIRYINHYDRTEICEQLLGFCPPDKQDAQSIAEAILSQVKKWHLEIKYLREQGYDGASTMSGRVSGAQQRIKELQPRGQFTHCRSHALNVVVVHGCSDVPLIRNTKATIQKIAVFFLHLLLGRTCYKKIHKKMRKLGQASKEKQEVSHSCQTLGGTPEERQ